MQREEQVLTRLVGNRLGYGLYHPATGANPLAVLYVALTDGLPPTIQVRAHAPSVPLIRRP